jgi:hypothetical protein
LRPSIVHLFVASPAPNYPDPKQRRGLFQFGEKNVIKRKESNQGPWRAVLQIFP